MPLLVSGFSRDAESVRDPFRTLSGLKSLLQCTQPGLGMPLLVGATSAATRGLSVTGFGGSRD
ncbi:hypothetical protein XTPLMG728_0445 [Xanthomonas translucens pv. poae]|uniref:Uncharacterized protein n=1 Tax=Xanthomonas graminis pv. poae TaxID=227946 RepID=A0A0K2ZL49_9XANT|nr:hypothetical protein XTPLMG728_0445 [Xanthomonas translucens pv. poae]